MARINGKRVVHTAWGCAVEQSAPDAYIGVDPGASGGVVCLSTKSPQVSISSMPSTTADLWGWVTTLKRRTDGSITAVLEKVTGYVGDGGNPGSGMFKFGVGYGEVRMALTAAGIPFEEVVPTVWQRGLGIAARAKGEGKTAWKNRLRAHAQKLFPGVKVTLATADALLIAEWCRRRATGTLDRVPAGKGVVR
jgi:hypothetical protein